jgi:uncharacterized protein YsxB (DUF464 family)
MIFVKIVRVSSENSHIIAFEVKGHAQYDVHGKDIVCAAVSAITIGTANAIESLAHAMLKPTVQQGYFALNSQESLHLHEEQVKTIQLLLESMVIMLETIRESYGEYITIQTMYGKGG